MKKVTLILGLSLFLINSLCAQALKSPDGNLTLSFRLSENKAPVYSLDYKGKAVVKDSKMGFIINSSHTFDKDFKIVDTEYAEANTAWQPVWGENKEIRDNHKEMLVSLVQDKTNRKLNIRFRLFDDGLGFRYEFPVQENLRHFTLKEEMTEFNLNGDHKAFWIPADYDTNEFPVNTSKLSEVVGLIDEARKESLAAKAPTKNLAVQTPLMMKSDDGDRKSVV